VFHFVEVAVFARGGGVDGDDEMVFAEGQRQN
jgi:hypothetical protein